MDNRFRFRMSVAGDRLSISTDSTEDHVRRLLNLDFDDTEASGRVIAAEPVFSQLIPPLRGLRMMQPDDPVETFFCFLCTANNHLKRIGPMCQKLGQYGEPLEGGQFAFPSAERISQIPEESLRAQGFGYRAATIRIAAEEIVSRGGDAYLLALKQAGYREAFGELLSIPFVGRKLADCICLFGLHFGEAVPIDTHLWQAAVREFFPQYRGQPLTDLRYRIVGDFFRDRFGKLAGWAHQRLYVDNLLRPRQRTAV